MQRLDQKVQQEKEAADKVRAKAAQGTTKPLPLDSSRQFRAYDRRLKQIARSQKIREQKKRRKAQFVPNPTADYRGECPFDTTKGIHVETRRIIDLDRNRNRARRRREGQAAHQARGHHADEQAGQEPVGWDDVPEPDPRPARRDDSDLASVSLRASRHRPATDADRVRVQQGELTMNAILARAGKA